jgi:hypothetical protein
MEEAAAVRQPGDPHDTKTVKIEGAAAVGETAWRPPSGKDREAASRSQLATPVLPAKCSHDGCSALRGGRRRAFELLAREDEALLVQRSLLGRITLLVCTLLGGLVSGGQV